MKRSLIYVIMAILLSLVLIASGCGKKEVDENTSSSEQQQSEQQQSEQQQSEQPQGDQENPADQEPNEEPAGDAGSADEPAEQTGDESAGQPEENTEGESADQPEENTEGEAADQQTEAQNNDSVDQNAENSSNDSEKLTDQVSNENSVPDSATASDQATVVEKPPFEEWLHSLPGKLNPDKVQGLSCVYQFNITDGHPGKYTATIKDGKCTVGEGTAPNPDITINVGEQLWLDLVSGKENGTVAFLARKYTVEGNKDLLKNMTDYFTK